MLGKNKKFQLAVRVLGGRAGRANNIPFSIIEKLLDHHLIYLSADTGDSDQIYRDVAIRPTHKGVVLLHNGDIRSYLISIL